MNGECKSFRLNDPITWQEFMSMPDDIKCTYIKLLREKFNVPDKYLAEMFGVHKDHVCRTFKKLGLQRNVHISHPKWDMEGFNAWWHGLDKLPTPIPKETVEEPVIEEVPVLLHTDKEHATSFGNANDYMEEDLPVEEPYPATDELNLENGFLKSEVDTLRKVNDELMAVHEKDKQEIAWLRNECESQRMNARILEAQMEVVRMIFGGKNHG